jgi:hypothetical protein
MFESALCNFNTTLESFGLDQNSPDRPQVMSPVMVTSRLVLWRVPMTMEATSDRQLERSRNGC